MHRRVLVVDDDEAVRVVLSELLQSAGIETRCACDGQEALEHLRAGELPDLVLLDLCMPLTNGWEVLEAMRAEDTLRALPVIVLTSLDEREDVPAGVPVMHKPVDPELLFEVVAGVLDRPLSAAATASPVDSRPLARGARPRAHNVPVRL